MLSRIKDILSLWIMGMAWIAGMAVVFMMGVTCVDVISRLIYRPLTGTYDLVRISGAVAIACAVPYTTAIKGHVAIEYFFHKLGLRGRLIVDTVMRVLMIVLFGVFAWQSIRYGQTLRNAGQVTLTLQIPVFWIPFLISLSCFLSMGVVVHNLFHPGKEMIKP